MNETNKKTILIVDDSAVVRETIKGYLKDEFDIVEAVEPRECLKILAADKPKIDLGLIDVEMPEMNGFQLLKMLKKHPAYKDVPFIMVTSKDDSKSVSQAVLAGACDYIGKPFKKETLLEKIEKHLKKAPNANSQKDDAVPVKDEEISPRDDQEPAKEDAPVKGEEGTASNGDDVSDQLAFDDE